jgi:hypothetical protein
MKKMKKTEFSLTRPDESILELVGKTDHKTVAVWALDCAERVLPYFENEYPEDQRPRQAVETLRTWIKTGVFRMAVIRGTSLAAHAAARETGENNAARSAARAAGQAVATAHVPAHSIGAAAYALQAVSRAAGTGGAALAEERDWQYRHLREVAEKS